MNSTREKRVRTLYGMAKTMARSKGVTISVKVPINWESMTERTRQRLRQTVGRDTRVIRAFLGIIEQNEDKLLTCKNKDRIDDGKVDQLTMTALKVKSGASQRTNVPHNFKVRFPRISQNEMTECRQTAVALYESYLKLNKKKGWNASRPTIINGSRRIPRWVFSQRFKLIEKKTSTSRWWLDIRDALDSAPEKRFRHDRLSIPLKISPYQLNQIRRGEVKAVQLFTDRTGKSLRCSPCLVDIGDQVVVRIFYWIRGHFFIKLIHAKYTKKPRILSIRKCLSLKSDKATKI